MVNGKDIVIIGGGPAGYTAAIYASRAGYSCAVIEKMTVGGQMGTTSRIENYPGFTEIGGYELASKMMEQAQSLGAELLWGEVKSVLLDGKRKRIVYDGGEIEAAAVIIATGASPRLLGVTGEAEYKGRGVSYCATCDGMFFRGKTVVVNGGGDTAVEDALYLSNIAAKVYVVHRRDKLRAVAAGVAKLKERENIELILESTVGEIIGDGARVTGVTLVSTRDGEARTVRCDGVFVAIGRVPDTELFASQLDLTNGGYIAADETCRTNIAGVFAAGDVREKPLRQIITACADGAVAVKFAEEYLSEV